MQERKTLTGRCWTRPPRSGYKNGPCSEERKNNIREGKLKGKMRYKEMSINLVRKAQARETPLGYSERHHVFPRSLFGENNFLVRFTAREHFVAHFLLYKACLQRYGASDYRTRIS